MYGDPNTSDKTPSQQHDYSFGESYYRNYETLSLRVGGGFKDSS